MSTHENTPNGIYLDEETGDIWRKPNDKARWEVNGQTWIPFPKRLTPLRTMVDGPAVSLADVAQPEPVTFKLIQARYSDIILSTRQEASQVLEVLSDIIEKYSTATVLDLYDSVGIVGKFNDQKLGWRDLNGATIERVRDGYLLNLPAPQPI